MQKLTPITIRAASLTLTGSLVVVVGNVSSDAANATSGAIALGDATLARLVGSYARHASSTTGSTVFAIDVSMDAPTTPAASVANWVPVLLLDASTFSAGAISAYPEAVAHLPSAAGTTTRGTPPWDVRGANWMRVRVADVDGTNPGALASLAFGGQ